MKKWVVFLMGVVAGFVLTMVVSSVIGSMGNAPDITRSDQVMEFTVAEEFKVFRVIDNNSALAFCSYRRSYGEPLVLIIDDKNQFYDNQIIEIPDGKRAFQIGTYSYIERRGDRKTVSAIRKTVPAIEFR